MIKKKAIGIMYKQSFMMNERRKQKNNTIYSQKKKERFEKIKSKQINLKKEKKGKDI